MRCKYVIQPTKVKLITQSIQLSILTYKGKLFSIYSECFATTIKFFSSQPYFYLRCNAVTWFPRSNGEKDVRIKILWRFYWYSWRGLSYWVTRVELKVFNFLEDSFWEFSRVLNEIRSLLLKPSSLLQIFILNYITALNQIFLNE